MATVRSFEPERDLDEVYGLWQNIFPHWIMSPRVFRQIISAHAGYMPGDHLIAEEHGRVVGLIATQTERNVDAPPSDGHIVVLMVAPHARRQGIGTMLHLAALDHFTRRQVRRVQLGGGEPRFWPGVPSDLESGPGFFTAQGWIWDHTVVDMIRDVRDFATPGGYAGRAAGGQLQHPVRT